MSLRFPSRSQLSTLALLACVVVLSSCAGYDHQNAPELARIDVSTSSATIAVGATQQFAATGHFNDGSTQDITTSVAWTSQNTAVATINAAGLVSAKSAGSSAITAASGGLTSSMSL